MFNFNQLRIGARLGAGFTVLVVLMLAIVVSAKVGLSDIGKEVDLVLNDRYVKVKLSNDIGSALDQQARSLRNLLIMDQPAQRDAEIQVIEKSRAAAADLYKKLEPTVTSEAGKAQLAKVLKERADYAKAADAFLQRMRGGDVAGAKALLFDTLRPQQLEYVKVLDELVALQEGLMDASGKAAVDSIQQTSMMMIVAALVGLVVAVGAAVVVTRSVTRPVGEVVSSLQTVARGDLTVEVRVDRGDEIGALQRALADTVASLRKVVGEVRSGVDSVTTASSQIAAGNQDLSSRTEEQASSLQQTASSMEELSGTVRQSADNAQQANQLAASASVAAGQGGEIVNQVVSTMEEITASSRKIADIIGTIDGIAFQTNILALNAAVEAARAGEQGRGFAVVAGEVRALAQRSAEAAREIKALIGNSVDKVEAGSRQVAEAGTAMAGIVAQVRKVTDLIGEIASASQEQSTGIGQVSQAVSQMDQVTQQNAALVEESAAAADSLSQQARKLADAVSAFKLGTHDQPRPAAAPVARAELPKPAIKRTSATSRLAAASASPAAKMAAASTASDKDWTSF